MSPGFVENHFPQLQIARFFFLGVPWASWKTISPQVLVARLIVLGIPVW